MSRSKKTTSTAPLIPNVGPVVPKPVTPVRIWPMWRDAALIDAVCVRLSDGIHETTAGELSDLAPSTVPTWLYRLRRQLEDMYAEEAETGAPGEISEFAQAVMPIARAHAEFIAGLQRRACGAMPDGQATWMLARLKPQAYGQKQEIAVSSSVRPISDDETRALLVGNRAKADEPEDDDG